MGPSWLSCIQWNLSIKDTNGTQLAVLYREVSVIQRICTQLYVVGTADSVLIREVPFIQCPLSRGSTVPAMPTCPHGCMHITHITHTFLAHTHAHMHTHLRMWQHTCSYIHLNYRHVTLTWIKPCWFLGTNWRRARCRRWGRRSGGRGCSVNWNAKIIAQASIAEAPQLVRGDF